MKKLKIVIEGMHCSSCAKIIEMELKDKVNSIKVDYERGMAEVDFNEKKISLKGIKDIIKQAGYKTE